MRLPSILLLAGSVLAAQQIASPRIGIIEFYGLHKVSEKEVRKVLGFAEGDPLPTSKGDVEDRLEKIPGVYMSHLEATCCTDGKIVLYVGIEERGAPHFDLHDPPEGAVLLPHDIEDAYHDFLSAVNEAVRTGQTGENLSQGHSLMENATARAAQLQFIALADKNLKVLEDVLRNSYDEEQRAIAAYVIGYASKKTEVVNDLQWALRDYDQSVRSNAARAMAALAVLAEKDPKSGIKIEPTWFIEMLNSIAWTDRHNAATVLVDLTDKRNPDTLEELRADALPSLVDMARWKDLSHALPAYILLGRIAGFPEKQIQDDWSRGDRETVIEAALKQGREKEKK